jgi:hypothetical protein
MSGEGRKTGRFASLLFSSLLFSSLLFSSLHSCAKGLSVALLLKDERGFPDEKSQACR